MGVTLTALRREATGPGLPRTPQWAGTNSSRPSRRASSQLLAERVERGPGWHRHPIANRRVSEADGGVGRGQARARGSVIAKPKITATVASSPCECPSRFENAVDGSSSSRPTVPTSPPRRYTGTSIMQWSRQLLGRSAGANCWRTARTRPPRRLRPLRSSRIRNAGHGCPYHIMLNLCGLVCSLVYSRLRTHCLITNGHAIGHKATYAVQQIPSSFDHLVGEGHEQ